MKKCTICDGAQTIRIPADGAALETFPCPKCAPLAHTEHFIEIAAAIAINPRFADADSYVDHLQSQLAHQLAMYLYNHDLIDFQTQPADPKTGHDRAELRAILGVLGKASTAKITKRIHDRQLEVARMLISEAVRLTDRRLSSEAQTVRDILDDALEYVIWKVTLLRTSH